MRRSLNVFLCGTFADLKTEREAVLEAIRHLKAKHTAMEFFGARPGLPLDTCLDEVRMSDVIVVIVGHRYGSLVPELGISFSEAEYREAYRLRKPCLVYVRSEDVPVLLAHVDRDPEMMKLLATWKQTLLPRHTVSPFKSANDLAMHVIADLAQFNEAVEVSARTSTIPSPDAVVKDLHRGIESAVGAAIELGMSEHVVLAAVHRAITELLPGGALVRARVLLCHSLGDRDLVRQVAEGLEEEGADVLLADAAPQGTDFVGRLTAAIEAVDYVAFFVSARLAGAQWARAELDAALWRQLSRPGFTAVFPVILDDTDVSPLLRSVVSIDMRDGDVRKGVRNLVAAIERQLTEHLANPKVGL